MLYHTHSQQHLEDLPFWMALAAQYSGRLLELGCGTGRVLVPLAQAGHAITGLDIDGRMLRFLSTRLDPGLVTRVSLLQADLSAFHLAERFTSIFSPCNTWSTLPAATRQDALVCIREHLSPGGCFAASLPNPVVLRSLPARSEPEFEESFAHPRHGYPVQVSSSWQRTRRHFIVTWDYDVLKPDGNVERLTFRARHQLDPTNQYLAELKSAGLALRGLFGNYDRSPYTPEADFLILLAEKGG
jgi:SAM-dependent methyltransferase